jgi:MFS family permease
LGGKGSSHYGWVVVAVSFITLALAYGVWYSFSVFFVALLKEFGWSRSVGAGGFSIFVITHSLMAPLVGGMVDRFGPRRVILVGLVFVGVGLALCSVTTTWWNYYIFFGVITAMGVGAIGWVPNTTTIQQWFKAKRGLAIGLISSGIGIGILVCIPLIQHLISRLGWRMAYRLMACSIPLIVAPMAIAFLKRSPQTGVPLETDLSEREITPSPGVDASIVNEEWASRPWTIRRAMTTRQFWFLSIAFPSGGFAFQSILAHQVAFFVDQGVEALLASYIVGLVGISSVGAKLLLGILSDNIGREVTYTAGISGGICGMIVLILFQAHPHFVFPYLYGIFISMGYAATAALPPIITADFFEGRGYGGIFGTLIFLSGLGGASGAWFAGFLHDRTESYVPVFIVMIACAGFACLNIWRAAPRKIRSVPGKRQKLRPSSYDR